MTSSRLQGQGDEHLRGNEETSAPRGPNPAPASTSDDTLALRVRAGLPSPAGTGSLAFFRPGEREAPRPATGLSVGKVVADFRLLALIGQGGMGQVWEAEQVSLQRRVAVKFVRPERVTERQLELFAREARAGGRLSHPGIVTVHGHGQSEGLAWIAMEFVEGAWTLRDFLDETMRTGEVPAGYDLQVAKLVAQIAEAMQAAHDAGVIHRDLKPQNVLITRDDRPKVTDFGLARITDEPALSQTGDLAGTYFYMSPEQVLARRMGIDHRTDVFSLGTVLYELLALRRPFEGDTSHQVAAQIVTKDPPDIRVIRSRVPRDLAVIAGKALEKDRDKRFQTMSELAADLRRHLANEPIHARPPMPVERLVKWVRRNPARSVALGSASVAFTIVTLLLVTNLRTKRALEVKTLQSEARRLDAELSARRESARAAEVERMRTLDRVGVLLAEAERGPTPESAPTPEWLAGCREFLEALPAREAELADLRTRAIETSPGDQQASRARHPRRPELETLVARLGFLEHQHAVVSGDTSPDSREDTDEAVLGQELLPEDFGDMNRLAREWVGPEREIWGKERAGVALARRAVGLATDSMELAQGLETLAWGLLETGRVDEGVATSLRAAEEAQVAHLPEGFGRYVKESILKHARQVADPRARDYQRQHGELEARREQLEREIGEDVLRFQEEQDANRYQQVLQIVRSMRRLAERLAFLEAAPERDARRIEDIVALRAALEKYRDDHGSYPEAHGSSSYGGWEVSNDGGFIPALRDEGYVDEDGMDPINNSLFHYRYAHYSPGSYGCPGEGDFYVVGVRSFETPGFQPPPRFVSCSGRDWGDEFAYVAGSPALESPVVR